MDKENIFSCPGVYTIEYLMNKNICDKTQTNLPDFKNHLKFSFNHKKPFSLL